MKYYIVKLSEGYCVFKQYQIKDMVYARPIAIKEVLREAVELIEDEVPANNVGSGNIAGVELGYPVNKKKKLILKKYGLRNGPKPII